MNYMAKYRRKPNANRIAIPIVLAVDSLPVVQEEKGRERVEIDEQCDFLIVRHRHFIIKAATAPIVCVGGLMTI